MHLSYALKVGYLSRLLCPVPITVPLIKIMYKKMKRHSEIEEY